MAQAVLDVAQGIQDDFEQGFRAANSFFTLEDYARKVCEERDSELEREFLVQYQQNKRSFPVINPNWLKTVFIDLTKDHETGEWSGLICEPLFEFPFDELGSSVVDVSPSGNSCGEFVRISHHQSWAICMTPTTDMIFFSVQGCRLLLYNFFGCTEKARATIVPSQSGLPFEQQSVPDGKVAQIKEVVLNRMFRDFQVKLGKISAHNSGNPNPSPNETDLIYDGLKTK